MTHPTVKSYVMEQTCAEQVTAFKLQTRYDGYESYRLDIVNPTHNNILDSDLWAEGLIVRRFYDRPNAQPRRDDETADTMGDSGTVRA